jgi:hypothetical protein
VDWTTFIFFSPIAIMGILLIVYAATIKEMVEVTPRYAKATKYSVGAYRALGVGFISLFLILGFLMAQPMSSHEPKPFPSTQVSAQ